MSTIVIKVALHIHLKIHPNIVLTGNLTFKELILVKFYNPIVATTLLNQTQYIWKIIIHYNLIKYHI
jgi:hypothetical protein